MDIKKLNEEFKSIMRENEESLLLDELEDICIKKGFEYKKYVDAINIKDFRLHPGYGSTIQDLTVYIDGGIEIRENGPLSLVPQDFEIIIELFDLIDEYKGE